MSRKPELLLGAGALALYVRSMSNGLTNWDDPDYITRNALSAHGWRGPLEAFWTPFDGAYYPVTQAMYAVVRALGGEARALHVLQALAFAAAVALVPAALRAFGASREVGLAAALVWAAHPLRVESVAWAANLKDALGIAFFLGALAAFGAGRPRLALAAFVGAVLSKSTFFSLAPLFTVVAWERPGLQERREESGQTSTRQRRPSHQQASAQCGLSRPERPAIQERREESGQTSTRQRRPSHQQASAQCGPTRPERAGTRRALWRTAPFLVVGVAAAGVAGLLHAEGAAWAEAAPVSSRVATALWTPWWYALRTLWPSSPVAIYDVAPVEMVSWRLALAAALIAGLGAAALKAPPKVQRALLLAAVATGLALLPVGGLVPLRRVVADRYSLVPSLALLAGLAAAVQWRFSARAALVTAGVAAAVLAPLTVAQQAVWADSVTLWEATVARTPRDWTVRINLADAYAAAGQLDAAERETAAALALRPERKEVLGQLLRLAALRDGVPPDVLEQLEQQARAAHYDTGPMLDAAEWCLANQHLGCARAVLDHLPEQDFEPRAQRMLSAVARQQARPGEAIVHARRAIELGEPLARVELVYALADADQLTEALSQGGVPMGDDRGAALLLGAHAYVLMKLGRDEEARTEAEAALRALQAGGTPSSEPVQ